MHSVSNINVLEYAIFIALCADATKQLKSYPQQGLAIKSSR